MGVTSTCYSAENIEINNSLKKHCDHYPRVSSLTIDQISVKSEKSAESGLISNFSTSEILYTALSESGPAAKYLKAAVTFKSSVKKLRRKSSGKSTVMSWVSNPAHHLNTTYRRRKDKNSIVSLSSDRRAMEDSASSTFVSVPMTSILPYLWLGSYDDAINVPELQANGITHILSLIGNTSPVDFVQHENYPMHDRGRTDLKRVLKKVSKFVKLGQKDGNSVLVHCQCGQNRSPVVVIALMMKNHKKTLYRAYKKVKSLRPIVQINERYAKQLLALEKEIFGKNSLPREWMERGEFDLSTGEVAYKYEHINSAQHRAMFD